MSAIGHGWPGTIFSRGHTGGVVSDTHASVVDRAV